MKNTLVVAADLGGFKAYQLDNNHLNRTPRLELLEHFDNSEAHERLMERVTDQSGRFPRAAGGLSQRSGAMSDGERHNISLEMRKRYVRRIAKRLNSLIGAKEVDRCYLAASREINHPLWDELEPRVRSKIERNVPADLTKVSRSDLLGYFQPAVPVDWAGARLFA